MITQLRNLELEKAIVHDVPKHKKDDFAQGVTYSEQESNIPADLKLFFKNKIIEALGGERAIKICFNENNISPINASLTTLFNKNDNTFISSTQDITKHIYNIQTGQNSGGLIVVFIGKINSNQVSIILKLERDNGAQLKMNDKTKSFDIVDVKEIMLTEKTKLYKVGMLANRDSFGIDYDGVLMDYQLTPSLNRTFASFFLNDFLGCLTYHDAREATKNFFGKTKEFINTTEDPILKAKYLQDLYSFVQKNTNTISPKQFAEDHLKTAKERDTYKNFLKINDIPFTQIPKDLQYIESGLKKIMIAFENGIDIIAKDGDIGKKIILEPLKDGRHKATITSKIKNVS